MRRLLLIGALALAGCDEDGRIPGVEPPAPQPMANLEYHYQDRVVVTQGFYEGSHGTVLSYDFQYLIKLDDGVQCWIGPTWLRRESE